MTEGRLDWQSCVMLVHVVACSGYSTYCAIFWFVDASTVASSLIKCGLFAVFSSCSMTAITMSSLMPSVSTLRAISTSPGDGGGVCSSLILCEGGGRTDCAGGDRAGERGVEMGDSGASSGCDRFCFFAGGICDGSSDTVGFEFARCSRVALGSCMPREDREMDFRRVL